MVKETYGEICVRLMKEYNERLTNREVPKPETMCKNYECPYKVSRVCGHNVYRDGLDCKDNDIGMHYTSQQQAIYDEYEADCERKGLEPMSRELYFRG